MTSSQFTKQNNDFIYLQDILEAIEKIEQYIKNYSYIDFTNDSKTQDAVMRNIEIIGEAANRLSKEFTERHQEIPVANAIGMRNVLIHDYGFILLDKVWDTIVIDLPPLKKQITNTLAQDT